jgi:hypothetical protein
VEAGDGGNGPPLRSPLSHARGKPGRPPTFTRQHTLARHLRLALERSKLGSLTWYQATRHTFASQWVLGGGTIEKLSKVMGHASVVTTERYAHLRTDLFREADYEVVRVDLSPGGAEVVALRPGSAESPAVGYDMATQGEEAQSGTIATG